MARKKKPQNKAVHVRSILGYRICACKPWAGYNPGIQNWGNVLSKLKNEKKEPEPFTMVPNRVLRSLTLSAHDKIIFALIASCGAHDTDGAFPSYEKLMEWGQMSRERVWKSLARLEQGCLIRRYRVGRKSVYRTWWNSSSGEPIGTQPVRLANYTSSSGELEPVRLANSIKIQDKEFL